MLFACVEKPHSEVEARADVTREKVVKYEMKEIKKVCDVVFWKQRTDPFEDEKDCV